MPLEPVYKLRSPKNVPTLALSPKAATRPLAVNTRMAESDSEGGGPASPYSMEVSEKDYTVQQRAPGSASPQKINPGHWVKVDDGTGNAYLYNLNTQESKWPSPVKAGGRTVGWHLYYDESGNAYYYNEETGAVTWDSPFVGDAAAAGAATASGGQMTPKDLQQQQQQQQQQPLYKSKSPPALAAGWEVAVDPETETKYYFNATTQESQVRAHSPSATSIAQFC